MGFFSDLFFGSDGSVKTGQSKTNFKSSTRDTSTGPSTTVNRYTSYGGKSDDHKHVHDSYNANHSTGDVKMYHGGENSSDRSYNQDK